MMSYYQNPAVQFNYNESENSNKKSEAVEMRRTFGYKVLNFIALTFGVLSLTLLIDLKSKSSSSIRSSSTTILKDSEIPDFDSINTFSASISVKSPEYGTLQSLSYLPWSYIAEPHREQTIEINSINVNGNTYAVSEEAFNVKWSIADKEYNGQTVTFQVDSQGTYECKVTISLPTRDSDGKKTTSYTHRFDMIMKYVRREIRSLTDTDRENFFEALKKVYTLKKSEGRELYGEKFKSSEDLLLKHLNGAGTSDCDHWHDGPAILTHHVGFTLEVEQALQSIDKSIAMPYWEYGMDKYLYPETFVVSPVFNSEWFGIASPTNGDHRIDDESFWANVKFPSGAPYSKWNIKASGSLNPFVNAYGYLRSPWNNNPVEGICRSNSTYGYTMANSLPSCDVFKACFQSKTLAETNYYLNGVTHGPVHIMIGGAWGETSVFKKVSTIDFLLKGPMIVLLFKILWRMGYTRCPVSCSSTEACRCSIPQKYIDTYGAQGIAINSNISSFLAGYIDMNNDSLVLDVLRGVEDPGIVGDMLTSSAAYDPTFWPLHGSAERLMAYKRALMSQKVSVISDWDDSWGYPSASIKDLYLYGVCDWSNVSGPDDLTLPICTIGEKRCPGHNENDFLEFSNFIGKNETYTNREMWEFMHPWNAELPYVYDTFDYKYCTDEGFDFLDYSTAAPSAAATTLPTAAGSAAGSPPDLL